MFWVSNKTENILQYYAPYYGKVAGSIPADVIGIFH